MKNKNNIVFLALVLILALVGNVLSQDITVDLNRQERIEFGHIVLIENIRTDPGSIIPGESANLYFNVVNGADINVKDVRINLDLPPEIGFLNDVSRRKLFSMYPGESNKMDFNLIALPDTVDGIYDATLLIEYISKTGEERSDEYTFSITVRSPTQLYTSLEKSDLYLGTTIGEVSVKFVNNGLGDIKFLTTTLQESEDYDILSSPKEYVGDLDSDDFDSVTYNLKVSGDKNILILPIKATYKDSLNSDHEEDFQVIVKVRDSASVNPKASNTTMIVIIVVVVIIVLYFLYRKFIKKKKKKR